MRHLLAFLIPFLATAAQAATAPGDGGQPHPTLKPVDMKVFCGSMNCSASAGGEPADGESGKMRFLNKKAIVLKTNAQKYPVADWGPSTSYRVSRRGQEWGACTEYPNQRTGENSVILLPWENHNSVPDAHRFVGEALSCQDIVEGERSGELILPVVERSEGAPRLVLWHCHVGGCNEEVEIRSVRVAHNRERALDQSGT
ncbi:hypothetical protein [Niveibacterium terrae]|uniref:hypothetical protein n=1 Tax=Niveibacterium terrae TaxID=3373598 RepID=UPI003A8F7A99